MKNTTLRSFCLVFSAIFALNNNQPVIASGQISQTGGIRDPHILRCEDGKTFYLVATDMFTVKNGWNTNPGIVMLSSDDLINWKHSIIDLAKLYPKKFGNVKWVWAPQTIYDPKEKKYMVYFTVRFHDDDKLDFYADSSVVVEGSSVFKLNNSDEYFLMYDLYRDGRYEFQRSADLYSFTSKSEAFTKNFNPRHGSVISITKEEARRLHSKWGGVPGSLLQPVASGDRYHFQSKGNPVITHHFTADPAALVRGDTLWLFTGHDLAGAQRGFNMRDWLVFSSTDLVIWTEYPVSLKLSDFEWAEKGKAYAAQPIERNGKFYWYVSTDGLGIGVAVSNRPEGPYKDAIGKPLLTKDDCFASTHSWSCIDPTVFIDDDGQAWLFWGNGQCYKGKHYFIYHNGSIQRDGGGNSRSVCIDRMYYHEDGTIKRIMMTTEGPY